eukprot:878896_1
MSDHNDDYHGIPRDARYTMLLFLCLLSWCMAILLLYCLYVFNKLKTLVIYKKRYPNLVILECILAIICALFIWPLFANYDQHLIANRQLNDIANGLLFCFYPYLGHAITCIEACRLWCMYYKLNYMNAVSRNEWKSVIDTSSAQHNWFLSTKQTYGSAKWVAMRWFAYYLFAATTSMVLIRSFGFRDWTQFVDLWLYAVPIFFVTTLGFKLFRNKSLVQDNFWFYYEFATTILVYGIAFVFYLSDQIMYLVNWYFAVQLAVIICIFGLSSVSIVSALYIPKLILEHVAWKHAYTGAKPDVTPAFSNSVASRSNSPLANTLRTFSTMPPEERIAKVFGQKSCTELFIHHMITELSVEVVLAWMEMRQFSDYMYTKCASLKETELSEITHHGSFANHIPKATIIYDKEGNDDMDGWKNMYVAIYDKYIAVGSAFEINISWELRERYANEKDKNWNVDYKSAKEVVNIFDPIIRQMQLFMHDSFYRFTFTADFEQVHAYHIK